MPSHNGLAGTSPRWWDECRCRQDRQCRRSHAPMSQAQCTQCVWKRKRQCTAAGSMHDAKIFIRTSWQTRLYAYCALYEWFSKWGVPFGPTVLGYPPSDCSADFTTRTPIHPYNTSFFQNLKICPRLHLRAKSLGRRREFRSNFGIFLGLLPPRRATTPKYGVRYKLGTTP